MRNRNLLIYSFLLFFATALPSCTGYLKDSLDDSGATEKLQLSAKSCELNKQKTYAEIKINNGSGRYYALPTDLSIATATVEGNVVRIFGIGAGEAYFKVVDDGNADFSPAEIRVTVKENIERLYAPSKTLYIKKDDLRLLNPTHPSKDCDWTIADQTIASLSTSSTGTSLQANRVGETWMTISKEYWTIQEYVIKVVEQYDLMLSGTSFRLITQKLGIDMGICIIQVGNGQYSVESSDETIATASIKEYNGDEYNDTLWNPAIVWVKALKPGRVSLGVTDLVTGKLSVINLIIELRQ